MRRLHVLSFLDSGVAINYHIWWGGGWVAYLEFFSAYLDFLSLRNANWSYYSGQVLNLIMSGD